MKLTKSEARALKILSTHGAIRPARFAEKMWPDSPGWERRAKCGPKGVHKGGGMYKAAGCFLGKLRKKGLTTWSHGDIFSHVITTEGEAALREHEQYEHVIL